MNRLVFPARRWNATMLTLSKKEEFVQTLIVFLEKKLSKDFDRWVLVAPPEILSDFRQHLDPKLKEALAGELAKDLTKIPSDKILNHLHGVLPI
jgi:protein required for attachment to host cells